MKIVSWNVNSVRARIDNILQYLKEYNPDIVFLQEIKTQEETFPKETFEKNGFYSHVFGQKSYNGVAFLTKKNYKTLKKILLKTNLASQELLQVK